MPRRPRPVRLSHEDLQWLRQRLEDPETPDRVKLRIRVLLMFDEGRSNAEVAETTGASMSTIVRLRTRFSQKGVDAVVDQPRGAESEAVIDRDSGAILTAVSFREGPPWTTYSLADFLHMSQSTVSRALLKLGVEADRLPPHAGRMDPRFPFLVTPRKLIGCFWGRPRALAFRLAVDDDGPPFAPSDQVLVSDESERPKPLFGVLEAAPPDTGPQFTAWWFLDEVARRSGPGEYQLVVMDKPDAPSLERLGSWAEEHPSIQVIAATGDWLLTALHQASRSVSGYMASDVQRMIAAALHYVLRARPTRPFHWWSDVRTL